MNKHIYIILAGLLLASCASNKGIVKTDAPVSSKDYPYIDAFHKGMQYKVQGRVDEAILEFEKCTRIRQDDDAVYYALSKLELERGNSEISAEYIIKANKIDPTNTWYIEELAYMYYETESFAKAVEKFKMLTKIEPRNIDWMYGYSEALIGNGQNAEAIQVFKDMEAQVGKHPHFVLQRYNILMKSGKVADAEKELLQAKTEFPKDPSIIGTLVDHYYRQNDVAKAEKFLEELVIADPQNGRAHLALADIHQRRQDMPNAYKELKLAIESPDLDIDTKMSVLINVQEQSINVPVEMLPIVASFVQQYPDSSKAHSIQGDYYLQSGQENLALESYKQAVLLDNSLFAIWNQVLVLEYQDKQFENLYIDSKSCLELFPSIASVYLLNGISANKIKKFKEARETLSVGLEVVVNDPEMKAEFLGQLGEAAFGLQEFDEAITVYKKALALDSRNAALKNNFARRLAMVKKELELAESLADQITKAYPDEELFLDTRGWIAFQKGEYDLAKQWFEKVLLQKPTSAMGLEHMGDVAFKQNRVDDALKYWKSAQESGGGSEILNKKIADKKFYEVTF